MKDALLRVMDFVAAVGWLWMAVDVWTAAYPVPLLVRIACYAATGLHFVFR